MSVSEKDEPQRQCPACRNWVSILATRCHHCGETLGRPRKEEIRKTIKDLGGESHSQYSVSGNVMDALEAFREENLSEAEGLRRQKEEASQTWFGRKQTTSDPGLGSHLDMPELHGDHKSLADDILGENPAIRTTTMTKPPGFDPDIARNFGILIVAIMLLVGGYFFAWPAVERYIAERNKPVVPEHVNLTKQKMDAGEAPADVLQEAKSSVDVASTPENQELLAQARTYAENAIRAKLNTDAFSNDSLDAASALASQAVRIDPCEAIQKLAADVSTEVAQHKFILTSVDANAQKAVFKLNNPGAGADEQTVGVGEMLEGRFIVTAITSTSVRLEDTKRIVHGRQRPLISRPFQTVTGD